MIHSRGVVWLALPWAVFLATACGDTSPGENANLPDGSVALVHLCGDGQLQEGEECDDASGNDDYVPGACRTDCREARCGDWTVDPGEACDEGLDNGAPGSSCGRDCTALSCGDGHWWQGYEGCDDGDLDPGDGCSASCEVEHGWVCEGSPSVCRCADYRRGEHCDECIVYADAASPTGGDGGSWATAFSRLQPAVDAAGAAGPGCEVWATRQVYPVYQGAADDTLNLHSDVALYGGFSGTETFRDQRTPWPPGTVIDGGGGAAHVITAYDISDVTLDGVVVRGGRAMGAEFEGLGGGMFAYAPTRLAVRNALFVDNQCDQYGGGIFLFGAVNAAMSNVVFADNSAGEAGGAIYAELSELQVVEGEFIANVSVGLGGALMAYEQSDVEIIRSTFAGNTTVYGEWNNGFGGALYAVKYTVLQLRDSVVAGNRGGFGGGLSAYFDAEVTCYGTTFVGNRSAYYGGLFHAGGESTIDVYNSILTDNLASNDNHLIHRTTTNTWPLTLNYSISQGCHSYDGCHSDGHSPHTTAGFLAGHGNPVDTATWSAISYDVSTHQSLLEVSPARWTAGALIGRFLGLGAVGTTVRWVPILDNGADWISVWGDLSHAVGGLVPGDAFTIHDLALAADATALDAGDGLQASDADRLGQPRYDDPNLANVADCAGDPACIPGVDLGAYERQP